MKEIDTILNEEIKMRRTICSFSSLHIVVSKHSDDHILIRTFGILSNVLILLVYEIYMFYKDFFTCTSHHHNISCTFTRINGNLIALCVQEMLHKLYSIPKSIVSPNQWQQSPDIKEHPDLAYALLFHSTYKQKIYFL